MPSRPRIFLILLTLGLLFSPCAQADLLDQPDPSPLAPVVDLKEQILSVPVGGNPPAQLEVTLMMPVSGGPFPLVVMNHGSSPDPAHSPRLADNFTTYYFLSRGYAVALPLMRGYGNSTGHIVNYHCDAVAEGLAAARDISAVIDYVTPKAGIDPTRIVVAGKSIGGWHTLALGTLNIPNVRGLVSFAGGMKNLTCPTADDALVSGAAQFGAHTKLPSIWFFGENDKIFATATWQGMFKQYTAAGASSELVDIGTFMDDAHGFTASGAALPRWVPKLDAFLAKIGMPNQPVLPIYLPGPAPATSNYADINDLDAVPYLNTTQRNIYKRFLTLPLPRAIAIGLSDARFESGGFDPAATVMRDCRKVSHYCRLYAVDNTVVWPRLESAPPATQFAALSDVSAVPYLKPKGRAEYSNFLLTHRPRAFAIAPDGSWGAGSGLDPMTDALIACSRGHVDCALYAVDGDVVWPIKSKASITAKR